METFQVTIVFLVFRVRFIQHKQYERRDLAQSVAKFLGFHLNLYRGLTCFED